MSFSEDTATGLVDLTPSTETFRADVLAGLRGAPKTLPCKYFYDARGSQLFDRICELDEYYLTRTELAIMERHADEIAAELGPRVMLIEPGAGSGTKTRILLEHLDDPVAYVPVDISRDHLVQSADSLDGLFKEIEVLPVSADFTSNYDVPAPTRTPKRRVVYFPGSTIGNFERRPAMRLLKQIAELCGAGGAVLIGVDLKKDRAILEPAYDDAEGVTAEFNLNLLRRINGELDGDFDLDEFEHRAVYNPDAGRIEISLVSRRDQTATVAGETFEFTVGEAICTEHSHKYNVAEFAAIAAEAGLRLSRTWTDDRGYFAVMCLTAR